ncbi:chemotaxis protein CheW, partial [Halobacteriales archaeon QH_2_66_30]
MSDEDDRMDRARRIRQMREGGEDQGEENDDSGNAVDAGGDAVDAGGGTEDGRAADDGAAGDGEGEMEWGAPGGSTESDGDETRAPLPEADELEEALTGAGTESEAETVTPDVAEVDEEGDDGGGEETRVLEFTLSDEHYCLDIEYIEEIVKEETITRVPNTPAFVEGVVDLRGQITTILNPKVTIGKPDTTPGDLIVVFDSDAFEDEGHVGWVVDDVRQVSLISDAEVNDAPVEDEHINGVVDRADEDSFVVWTTPELV